MIGIVSAYRVCGGVASRPEGSDFTKDSYSGVQSDGFGGRVVGVER